MGFYRTGTISLTNGSVSVTGTGTDFIGGATIGECLQAPDGKLYEILSIQSSTALTLGQPYLGATASGQTYSIVPTQSYIRDLAGQVATLVNSYSATKTNALIVTADDKGTIVDADKLGGRDSVSGLAKLFSFSTIKSALASWLNGGTLPISATTISATGALTAASVLSGSDISVTAPTNYLYNSSNGVNGFYLDGTGQNVRVYTAGSEKMRIDAAGNLHVPGGGGIPTNEAFGTGALHSNTTGYQNTVSGKDALYHNTTGNQNTASGQAALYSNTIGSQNTASGVNALFSNTTGIYNTASGVSALYSNTVGNNNTASGLVALFSNTTGSQNTANGVSALANNTIGSNNTASGQSALQNNTTGNYNTACGVGAMYSNITGTQNTASGKDSMFSNTTGSQNTASGQAALYSNTTGYQNTASGVSALSSNTTGNQNTASGQAALYSNTIGSQNTASGVNALFSNTTGTNNTANGVSALYSNISGNNNTASGLVAMFSNTTGSQNTANGVSALASNTIGSNNTASGQSALQNNTTGNYNTACGVGAMYHNTTGNNNTVLGSQYRIDNSYAPAYDITTEDNRVSIAHTGVTNAYIQVAWTVVSDARDKTDFAPVPHGLDFVCQLKPTAYRYKPSRDAVEGHGPVRYGFKAQDILELEGETPVIIDTETPDKLRLNDQSMLAVLVNAIQELKAEFDVYKLSHP
jgi:hypothetical protein